MKRLVVGLDYLEHKKEGVGKGEGGADRRLKLVITERSDDGPVLPLMRALASSSTGSGIDRRVM